MFKYYFWAVLLFSVFSFKSSNNIEFQKIETQNSFQKNFKEDDGLRVDFIKTMCYDNEGFIWIAGENYNVRSIINNNKRISIQRFDGKNFHEFELPNYKEDIVSIENLHKRKDGKIYIRAIVASGQMLILFDPLTAIFKQVPLHKNSFIADAISNIFTKNNQNYILTQEGKKVLVNTLSEALELKTLFSFVPKTNKKYLLESSTQFLFFKDFCIISDDNFAPLFFDWNGNFLKKSTGKSIKRSFKENGETYFFQTNDAQLYKINKTSMQIERSNLSSLEGEVIDVFKDGYENLAIIILKNNYATINKFNSNGLLEKIASFPMEKKDFIVGLSKNIDKDIWLGTNNKKLLSFKKRSYSKNYLQKNSIRSLLKLNKNEFLVATETQGWYTINSKTTTTKPFLTFFNQQKFNPNSSRKFIKENNFIWSNDFDNIIRVNLSNGKTEKWNHYPVISMEKPNDSIIFYGTKEYYLMQFNTKTKKHQKLVKTDSLFIYDLAVKKNSNLVVCATNKGVLTYNTKTKKTRFFNKKNGLKDDFVLMIDKHKKHHYVLGTKSGKVIAFNPKNNQFKILYEDPFKIGIATITYDKNIWWISTFNGLVALDIATKKTKRFSEIDGLSHNEGNRYSALSTKDKLLIGSLKGLSIIDKKNIQKNEEKTNLVLLSISKYDASKKEFKTFKNRSNLSKNNTIKLPVEYKNLELNFALTNKLSNSDHNYRYRINNKNWIDLKHQQKISFINLASGNYKLEIEAVNFSGKRIASPLFLTIISQEFFYKTWWFYALFFLGIIIFLLWMLKQSKTKQKLQQQFTQDLIESRENERTRIARELHDSVNQQLTLIKKKTQKLELGNISEMINTTLNEVRSISRGLYPNILKQLGLTESIEQLLLEIDEETDLFVTTDIKNIDSYFDEKQALNLYRIIQEICSNVLKHAQATSFSFEIITSKNEIKMIAEDNGKGFLVNESKKKFSLGLKTLEERVQILNGNLEVLSEPNKGTKTVITIFTK